MGMAGPFHPPFSFCTAAKRERAVDGPREKTPRRVGLRRRRPPAAGGGRLAVPCGSQGRKRPALGETVGPGRSGIHPASLFAAANRWLMGLLQRADEGIGPYGDAEIHRPVVGADALVRPSVQAATTARGARSEAERAEREAGQMRSCTPTRSAPSATGRQYLPRRRVKRARRSGKIGAGTDTPTPVRTEGRCTGVRPSGLFFWTVPGPFSFPQDGKENGGCILAGQAPLAGASPPWPLFSGPHHSRGRAPKTGAPPLYFSSNTDTYTVPLTSNPSLAFT